MYICYVSNQFNDNWYHGKNLVSCDQTFGDCLGKNSELVKRKAHTYCNWLQNELDSIALSLLTNNNGYICEQGDDSAI